MVWKVLCVTLVLFNLLWLEALADDDEEEMCTCVVLGVTNDAKKCEGDDWKDPPIKVDMQMEKKDGEEGMPDVAYLVGKVDVGFEVTDGYQININVHLITPNGKDLMWSGGAEVCKSLGDKDAPWNSVVGIFNTTKCPIVKDLYKIPGMLFNLGFADSLLIPDYCGGYAISISIEQGMDKIMCFEISCEIYEDERPCKYCPKKGDDDKK